MGFFPLYCFFPLATGKKKINACNLQLADAEQINFRCLPRLLEEFYPPSLSPPPGPIMLGTGTVPGGSTEAAVPSLLWAGLPGWAAISSHAGSSVFPAITLLPAGAAQPPRADTASDNTEPGP